MKVLRFWLQGIRFYIAVGSLLLTALVIWWAHSAYAGTSLYGSRIEEVFAWLATGLLASALAIGPTMKLFPSMPGRQILFDARRLIGVSAAWFATLHVTIAYASQFKWSNPLALPSLYQRSFIFGSIALLILLAMAFTSFDGAFNKLGIWWFRLHRLVYVAAVSLLIHAFLTGVHATQMLTISIIATVCIGFMVAHSTLLFRASKVSKWQIITVLTMGIVLTGVITFGVTQHTSQAKLAAYGVR
jgi:sulfoxide reductase heme-binding subunit YedZ